MKDKNKVRIIVGSMLVLMIASIIGGFLMGKSVYNPTVLNCTENPRACHGCFEMTDFRYCPPEKMGGTAECWDNINGNWVSSPCEIEEERGETLYTIERGN